jgi:acyl carrier protein
MTTPRNNHLELVSLALQKVKRVESSRINENSRFRQDLELDSIALIDFFFEIEQATGHRVRATEIAQRFNSSQALVGRDFTIADLIQFLESIA